MAAAEAHRPTVACARFLRSLALQPAHIHLGDERLHARLLILTVLRVIPLAVGYFLIRYQCDTA